MNSGRLCKICGKTLEEGDHNYHGGSNEGDHTFQPEGAGGHRMGKRGQIAIVSSGDPAKDTAEIASAELHQSRMDANICPNGCGPMVWDDPHTRHCPKCNFVGWCNTPHVEGEA